MLVQIDFFQRSWSVLISSLFCCGSPKTWSPSWFMLRRLCDYAQRPHGAACEIVQAGCLPKTHLSPERRQRRFQGHWFHDWFAVVLIPTSRCRSTCRHRRQLWPSRMQPDLCQVFRFDDFLHLQNRTNWIALPLLALIARLKEPLVHFPGILHTTDPEAVLYLPV